MTETFSRLTEGLRSKPLASRNPIRYETENGFSIVRRCDLDDSISAAGREHCFVVRDMDGYELNVTVEMTERAVAEVIVQSRGRISLESSYWIAAAERHLADYLWQQGDYPPDARLKVDYLTLDDLDLARRWRETPDTTRVVTEFPRDGHFRARDGNALPKAQRESSPIRLLTENGYSIIRRSEVEPSATDTADQCVFTVEDPHGNKRDVCVRFDEKLIGQIQARRRNLPLSMQSKYWLVCAESNLSNYLWEHNQFPPDGSLVIAELPGDELLMAQHWRDQE